MAMGDEGSAGGRGRLEISVEVLVVTDDPRRGDLNLPRNMKDLDAMEIFRCLLWLLFLDCIYSLNCCQV